MYKHSLFYIAVNYCNVKICRTTLNYNLLKKNIINSLILMFLPVWRRTCRCIDAFVLNALGQSLNLHRNGRLLE